MTTVNPGHRLGQVSELTLVSKIMPGQVEILRGALQSANDQRIFVPVPAIHFARCVIITPPGADVERDSYLFFTCNYDGDFEALVAALTQHLAAELDAIWRYTEGWPGSVAPTTFRPWVLAHAVRANMAYTPNREATVPEILKGLQVDAAVQELFDAIRTQPAAHGLLAALES